MINKNYGWNSLKCTFCKSICEGYGNSPEPLKPYREGRACNKCNKEKVIPERGRVGRIQYTKIKISVLTPSIRPGGLKVVYDSLAKQTLTDFEWLTEISFPGKGCDLNAAYNRMLRRAKGDIIVSLQDFIKIPEDALQKIYNIQKEDTLITYPVAKVKEWGDKPVWDWRAAETKEIEPMAWEADFASAYKSMFFKVGGWDEELDKGWSWDNVNLAQRANVAGYKFLCYNEVKAIGLDHDYHYKHPFRGKNNNDKLINFKYHHIKMCNYKLQYLDN